MEEIEITLFHTSPIKHKPTDTKPRNI